MKETVIVVGMLFFLGGLFYSLYMVSPYLVLALLSLAGLNIFVDFMGKYIVEGSDNE